MSKLVITHAVEDVARWKTFDQERIDVLGKFATDIESHVDLAGGNMVAVSMNVHDPDGLSAMLASGSDEELHRRHGVLKPLTILKA